MPIVYEDHMGIIHIWTKKNSCKNMEYKGMHNNLTTCDGKTSDVLIQSNADAWKKRNLSRDQIREVESGWSVKKRTIKDTDEYYY